MPSASLQDTVLAELRLLRKETRGVTVETIARARAICRLLGSGDPLVAYTRLQHALLDATLDRTVKAAAASLGFSSSAATHLDRLVEAGEDLELDQRQVRRLSDQGLVTLAQLISTNWTLEAVPELTVIVTATEAAFELLVMTVRPLVVEMSVPTIEVLIGPDMLEAEVKWASRQGDGREQGALSVPVSIQRAELETSVVVVWRGELWPKFTTVWHGPHVSPSSETLGNKLMLRLTDAKPEVDLGS
jgi:hypothetical protein